MDFPGVVASDGAPFTESPFAVDVWLDATNRLVQLEGRAKNLNESDTDLKVDTIVRFTYVAVGPAPDPLPALPSPSSIAAPVGAP